MAFIRKFKRLFKKIFFPAKRRRKSSSRKSRRVKRRTSRRTPRRVRVSKPRRIQTSKPKKAANPKPLKKSLAKTTNAGPRLLPRYIEAGRWGPTAPPPTPPVKTSLIGPMTHFFPRIQVCVLKVVATEIKVGDHILIKGKKSNFTQKVASLQVESQDVKSAKKNTLVGLKLDKPAEVGDKVFKLIER